VDDIDNSAASAYDTPIGITNPPIDERLFRSVRRERVSSRWCSILICASALAQISITSGYCILGSRAGSAGSSMAGW